jgi:hypothetical protein
MVAREKGGSVSIQSVTDPQRRSVLAKPRSVCAARGLARDASVLSIRKEIIRRNSVAKAIPIQTSPSRGPLSGEAAFF